MIINKFKNKSFLERIISGIILVIIALITFIKGGMLLLTVITTVSIIGLYEMNKVFRIEKSLIGLLGYIFTICFYVLIWNNITNYLFALIVFYMMALMVMYVFMFPNLKTESVMAAVFGVVYVVAMLSFIYLVRAGDNGLYNVWLVFICSWGCDTCAYFAGVAFGKHKMAPVLSPKKSVEGAVGGVIGAMVIGFIYASVFSDKLVTAIDPRIIYPIICAVGSLVSMVGDLAASAIKRNHDIKDYGKLIPGHGGIMDRFDSVIFVAPLIWMLLQFMQ